MASANRPPPKFARSGSSSLTTTSLLPSSTVGSFVATAGNISVASTPQGTPPPPQLSDMDLNNTAPTIYTAVYSGVSVFEMTANNVAVMRRRHDSWLNATQILKVAGVEKGKRTRVIEKEIIPGEHEKVQGGYGKYQGTWINFARGREFCRAYGVEGLLAPLLDIDVQAAGGQNSTPTKEQAMAAKRKRMYNSSLSQSNGSTAPIFPPISATVTNAFNALSKATARMESPAPRGTPASLSQSTVRPETQSQEFWPPNMPSEQSFPNSQGQPDSTYASQSVTFVDSQQEMDEPPRKRARPSTPLNEVQPNYFRQVDTPAKPLPPLNASTVPNEEQVRQVLMNVFIQENDNNPLLHLDPLTPEQIDIPLDASGCAAIHWAASLARIPLLRALVTKGASIYRVNDAGETALVRGSFVTNNYDRSSFPQLLNLLHPTIPITDNDGRTILHHIAIKSGMNGRSAQSRYYLHCLLEFVAKYGSSTTQQRTGSPKVINLARFITEIVNARDKSGDTALNIAARIGNKSIIQQFLEVGADSSIPNRAGLRPTDFGVGGEPVPMPKGREPTWTIPPAVVQKRQDIVNSMKDIIVGVERDFQQEIEQKQDQVTATLNQLREATLKLGKEREKMNQLRQKSREHNELTQHCQNLRRAIEEQNKRFAERFPSDSLKNGSSTKNGSKLVNGAVEDLDPDAAYKITKPELVFPPSGNGALTPAQREYIKSLPPLSVLQARVKAYMMNEENLHEMAKKLHDRSSELESKFRRVVSLCTGVGEDRIDALLGGLVQAVESDPPEVDTARVHNFLKKVVEATSTE